MNGRICDKGIINPFKNSFRILKEEEVKLGIVMDCVIHNLGVMIDTILLGISEGQTIIFLLIVPYWSQVLASRFLLWSSTLIESLVMDYFNYTPYTARGGLAHLYNVHSCLHYEL